MSCDICGRGSCEPWFHSSEEQTRFEKVIEAFDRAREMRRALNAVLCGNGSEVGAGDTAKKGK